MSPDPGSENRSTWLTEGIVVSGGYSAEITIGFIWQAEPNEDATAITDYRLVDPPLGVKES